VDIVFSMLELPLQGIAAAVLSVCMQEDFSKHYDKTMIADNHHHGDCHKLRANRPFASKPAMRRYFLWHIQ